MHQRIAAGAGGGVDRHACGFVDDDDVVVFVHDIERDVGGGFEVELFDLGDGQREAVAGLDFVAGIGDGFAIAHHRAFVDKPLKPCATGVR